MSSVLTQQNLKAVHQTLSDVLSRITLTGFFLIHSRSECWSQLQCPLFYSPLTGSFSKLLLYLSLWRKTSSAPTSETTGLSKAQCTSYSDSALSHIISIHCSHCSDSHQTKGECTQERRNERGHGFRSRRLWRARDSREAKWRYHHQLVKPSFIVNDRFVRVTGVTRVITD